MHEQSADLRKTRNSVIGVFSGRLRDLAGRSRTRRLQPTVGAPTAADGAPTRPHPGFTSTGPVPITSTDDDGKADARWERHCSSKSTERQQRTDERRPSRLGELLVADGVISQAQLERALAEQRTARLPLGRTLIRLNFITEDVMRQALGRQRGVPFLDLDKMTVDPQLARIIGRAYAKRHALVPVSRIGQTLTVAMDDPTAAGLAGELTRLTGHTITIVTASSDAIQRTFRQLYEGGATTPGRARRGGRRRPPACLVRTRRRTRTAGPTICSRRFSARRFRTGPVTSISRCCRPACASASGSTACCAKPASVPRNRCSIGTRARSSRASRFSAKLDIAERRRPQDGSFQVAARSDGRTVAVDLRVSVIPSYSGESVVIRVLDRSRAPRSLDRARPVADRRASASTAC